MKLEVDIIISLHIDIQKNCPHFRPLNWAHVQSSFSLGGAWRLIVFSVIRVYSLPNTPAAPELSKP